MISLVVVVDGDIDFIVLLYLVGVSGVLVNVLNYELGKRRHSGVVVPYRCLSGKGAGMNPELI